MSISNGNYMFNECEIAEIKTGAAICNPASWLIMERFGFVRENETKMVDYTFLEKLVCDYQYYLTRDMYLQKKDNYSKKITR